MGNGSSTPRITAQDKAILEMKNQRDSLRRYQKRITLLSERETAIARECLRQNDKRRALLALRKKKYQETLLQKTDAQLAQLEQLTADVEFALVQKDVLYGLQQGTAVLKRINKEMGGIDKVEMILADNEEARAYQEEVSEMLAGQMSNADEDEVEDELERLAAEMAPKERVLPGTEGLVDPMPDAPKETPKERAARRQRDRERETAGREAIAA